jgi:signal transduction histidine kinase
VLLARLQVRQKLALLVLPLLVLVVIGAVPLVVARVADAEHSTQTARVVERGVRIGELVQELQQERLLSLGYVATGIGRERLVVRTARVLDLAEQLATDYAVGRDDALASVLRGVGNEADLGTLRNQVLRQEAAGVTAYTSFTEAINGLIDTLALDRDANLSTPTGRQELSLDSIVRHDEALSAAGAALFVEKDQKITSRVVALVNAAKAVDGREVRVFKSLAEPATAQLYELVEQGQSSQIVNNYLDRLVGVPETVIGFPVGSDLQPKVESLTALGRLVETRIAADIARSAAASATRDRWLATVGILLALVLVTAAAVLSVLVARSIAAPLRRLTESADEVADVAQAELVRVSDTEDPQVVAPQLRPVRVDTADELGELAQAFNRVQAVAANLVERQVVSRRNVATMFGNVGRRTQNLVGRQLAMIDSLERNEQDPELLERLYRLDHVSTRLRRNANSLVVVSGGAEQELTGEPLSVGDAIRSALGEIEGFQRVRLGEVDQSLLSPHVTADVVLLLAELLENGTSFSPPNTMVEVGATRSADGDVLVRIVDHGLGMSREQLAEENARLIERERLDLAPTDVLGLFVVGRLARRHGIRVRLSPTPGSGVTAEVLIPARHLVQPGAVPAVSPVPAAPATPAVPVAAAPAPSDPEPAGPPARGVAPESARRAETRAPMPGAAGHAGSTTSAGLRTVPASVTSPGVPAAPRPTAWQAPESAPADLPPRHRPDGAPTGQPPPSPPGDVPGRGWWEPGSSQADRSGLPAAPAASADEARQAIEDFEEGVRRALQEAATTRREDEEPLYNGRPRRPGGPPVSTVPVPTPPLPPAVRRPSPPDLTRALVEQFEERLRHALARLDAVSRRGPASDQPGGTFFDRPPSRPSGADVPHPSPPAVAPAVTSGDAPAAPERAADSAASMRTGSAVTVPPPRAGDGPTAAPPARTAVPDPARGSEGGRPLVRRVPGAQIPAGARAARPTHPQPPPSAEGDAARAAEAARALVEEFEAGVRRALDANGSDETREEGTE